MKLRIDGVRTTQFTTVTLAGLTCNISLVDGTAFITNPSVDLTPYRGCKIKLSDGTYHAEGWIKAAGSGETLGSEKITTWTNNPDTQYFDTFNTTGSTIDIAINTGSDVARARTNNISPVLIQYTLYKYVTNYTHTSGTAKPEVYLTNVYGGIEQMIYKNNIPEGVTTKYITIKGATVPSNIDGFRLYQSGDINFGLTNSLKQVLTPSATGVTIVSALAGSVYNWSYKHASFNSNAASFTATISA